MSGTARFLENVEDTARALPFDDTRTPGEDESYNNALIDHDARNKVVGPKLA